MRYYKCKPNAYNEHNFIEIPEGNHRVKIHNVVMEKSSNGKKCFEITLKVSGCHGKLWYFIWYNPEFKDSSDKNFSLFFDSFQIEDHDLSHYKDWIGKDGAVHVVHEGESKDLLIRYKYAAKISYCLSSFQRDNLPPWSEASKEIYPYFQEEVPF